MEEINNSTDKTNLKFEMSNIELVTITVGYILDKFIHLNIIFNYIDLDDIIIRLKFNNNFKGEIKKPNLKQKKDFKNQCTIIMRIKWFNNDKYNVKNINVKLFNNGKIIFTGCTHLNQIEIAINYIIDKLHNLSGEIPNLYKTIKISGDKELVLNNKIIDYLIEKTGLVNKDPELSYLKKKRGAQKKFKYIYKDKDEISVKTLFNMILIIKIYFSKQEIIDDIPNIYLFIDKYLINDTFIFPSYYENENKFIYDKDKIKILNINSRLNCGMTLNRNKIAALLKSNDLIENVCYDENIFPGVKAIYKNPTDVINKLAIIFFNSGKINITSTQNFEQIATIYKFIIKFCNDNYEEICIENDKINKEKMYINNLPNSVKIINDDLTYVFLKKIHIESNKRNKIIFDKYGGAP